MKSVKPGAILLLLMLILTACQKQEPAQPTYQTLPQVQAKYTADEIADFNNRRSSAASSDGAARQTVQSGRKSRQRRCFMR